MNWLKGGSNVIECFHPFKLRTPNSSRTPDFLQMNEEPDMNKNGGTTKRLQT
jgi:hypothetical protein